MAKDTNVKYEMMRVVTWHPSSISSYIPILMMQGKEGRNSISPLTPYYFDLDIWSQKIKNNMGEDANGVRIYIYTYIINIH